MNKKQEFYICVLVGVTASIPFLEVREIFTGLIFPFLLLKAGHEFFKS